MGRDTQERRRVSNEKNNRQAFHCIPKDVKEFLHPRMVQRALRSEFAFRRNPDSRDQLSAIPAIPPLQNGFHNVMVVSSKIVVRIFHQVQGMRSRSSAAKSLGIDQGIVPRGS